VRMFDANWGEDVGIVFFSFLFWVPSKGREESSYYCLLRPTDGFYYVSINW